MHARCKVYNKSSNITNHYLFAASYYSTSAGRPGSIKFNYARYLLLIIHSFLTKMSGSTLGILAEKLTSSTIVLLFNLYLYLSTPLHYYVCRYLMKMEKSNSEVVAYELTSAGACLFLSVYGVQIWFGSLGNVDVTRQEGIYATNDHIITYLIVPMFFYQTWNFIACALISKYRNIPTLGHHIATAGLSWLCLSPLCQYYIAYFFGICEISSVPLCFVLILDEFPAIKAKFSVLKSIADVSFGLSFIWVRIIYFMYIIKDFWFEFAGFYRENAAGNTVKLWNEMTTLFLVSVVLTIFQFYFLGIIINAAVKPSEKKIDDTTSSSDQAIKPSSSNKEEDEAISATSDRSSGSATATRRNRVAKPAESTTRISSTLKEKRVANK